MKWDGRYVAGISKVARSSARTEVVEHREGGDPSTGAQVARPHQVRGDHARARRHPRHRVRAMGQQGVELRLRPRRRGLAAGLPQGHHHRGLQRGRPARARLQGLPLLGVGVPGAARPRRQRQRRRDPDASSSRTRAGSATTTSPSRPSRASPSPREEQRNERTCGVRARVCDPRAVGAGVGLGRWAREEALLLALGPPPSALGARNAALLASAWPPVRSRLAAAQPLSDLRRGLRIHGGLRCARGPAEALARAFIHDAGGAGRAVDRAARADRR